MTTAMNQPASPTASSTAAAGGKGLKAAAVTVLLVGIAAGVGCFLFGGNRAEAAVKHLARAPIGCTTSLDFSTTGTFWLYVETKGTIGDVRGDCPNAKRSYHYTGANTPKVEITLTDPDGQPVALIADAGHSYDVGDYSGTSTAAVQIASTGAYSLSATSDEANVVVAIGRDPESVQNAWRFGGYIAAGVGLLAALVMLFAASRKRPAAPSAASMMPSLESTMPPAAVYTPSAPGSYTPPPTYTPPPPTQAVPIVPTLPTVPPPPPSGPSKVPPPPPPPAGSWPAPPSA